MEHIVAVSYTHLDVYKRQTEGKKADLFSKVRSGKVRVLLGSTAKMGAGTNVPVSYTHLRSAAG